MNTKPIISLCIMLMITSICSAEEPDEAIIKLEGFASIDRAGPGESFICAVIVRIKDGWHINAHKPLEDIYIASEIQFNNKKGLKIYDLSYPKSHITTLGSSEDKIALYSGKIVLAAKCTVSKDAETIKPDITGSFRYQACNDEVCMMPVSVNFTIPVTFSSSQGQGRKINSDIFSEIEKRWIKCR